MARAGHRTAAAAVAALMLAAGCAQSASGPPAGGGAGVWRPIQDDAAFRAEVVGRELLGDLGTLVVAPDGGFGGRIAGAEPSGSWRFEGGRFCRSLAIGGDALPEECLAVERGGDRLRFRGEDGRVQSRWILG